MARRKNHRVSDGNIFADLGLAQPEEVLAKAELADRIGQVVRARRLTQARAAEILGVDQPKISALNCGKLSGFSIERLMRFLVLLGNDVEIRVKLAAKPKADARLLVP